MSAGERPQCFFYLLDRHAPLAMTKGTKCPSTHHSCHSRARGPRKYECICGVVKAGILYPFSNNFCHSRVGGNRAWVVLIILFGEYFSVVFFYSLVIRDMNLIDPIPAFAGMTS